MLFKKILWFFLVVTVAVIVLSCGGGERPSEDLPSPGTPVELTKVGTAKEEFWVSKGIGNNQYEFTLYNTFFGELALKGDYTPEKYHLGQITPSFELILRNFIETHDVQVTGISAGEEIYYLTNYTRRITLLHMLIPTKYIVSTIPTEPKPETTPESQRGYFTRYDWTFSEISGNSNVYTIYLNEVFYRNLEAAHNDPIKERDYLDSIESSLALALQEFKRKSHLQIKVMTATEKLCYSSTITSKTKIKKVVGVRYIAITKPK